MRVRLGPGKGWDDQGPARDAFRFPPADGVIEFREERKRLMACHRKRRQRERQRSNVLRDVGVGEAAA